MYGGDKKVVQGLGCRDPRIDKQARAYSPNMPFFLNMTDFLNEKPFVFRKTYFLEPPAGNRPAAICANTW